MDALGNCENCLTASWLAQQAQIAYYLSTEETYADLCEQYVLALEYQIELCGDDGSIQAEINNLDCSTFPDNEADSHAIMTANINGEQYDNLIPFNYPTENQAVSISHVTNDNLVSFSYLFIAGTSTPETYTNETKAIILYIPEAYWNVGTYTLNTDFFNSNNLPIAKVSIVYYDGSGYWDLDGDGESDVYSVISNGILNITKFNLLDKEIEGTFEFDFELASWDTGEVILGSFECLNGTFDYSLDHPFFD